MEPFDLEFVDAGTWIGRQQAFALIAAKSALAQAQCLYSLRESGAHEKLGLTWEQFCPKYTGLSRAQADNIIRQLVEFGEVYFRLSELAQVSPESYRLIASHVHDDFLEFGGELIPITPENAPKIRAAVRTLRAEIKQLRQAAPRRPANIVEFQIRVDALLGEISTCAKRGVSQLELAGLRGLAGYAIDKWRSVSSVLESAAPEPEA